MKLGHLTVLVVVLAFLAAACGPGVSTDTSAPASGGTTDPGSTETTAAGTETTATGAAPVEGELVVALATEPNSLFSPNAAERNAINVASQIYEGAVWIDEENQIQPALATEWEISEDGTVFTLTLREGVMFHNGETMDADDWVASWEAAKDEANVYGYIYAAATSVEALDAQTVEVTLGEPDALFERKLADWAILPASQFEEGGLAAIEENPIGTGPFKFVSWNRGDRIVLEAFEDYWEEGLPLLAGVTFRPIPDSSTRLAAIQTGEVHIAQRFNSEEAATLEQASGVELVTYPVDRVYYIAFNNLTTGVGTPLEDPLVRKALNHAVDRQAIVDSLFDGQAALSTGLVATTSLGYDTALEPYAYDPELAMDLLAEAGYPDGFSMGMACPTGAYTNFEEVCQAVGGYLEAVGVTLDGGEIQFMESGQYWDLEAAKQLPPLFGDSWSSVSTESFARLQGALGTDADFAAWGDEQIHGYLDKIQATLDDEERASVYTELHNYMYEDPPFIYLYEPFAFEGVAEEVENYRPRAAENYFLKSVSLSG
ncbi:MAG: ABC transporter substrate-binding protein [Actinobacteria bacterium]|nr:ABC transporter substrate-binding protein [Actinomycetota bacterium]